jgi:cobalamin-dependent methionine synthase I
MGKYPQIEVILPPYGPSLCGLRLNFTFSKRSLWHADENWLYCGLFWGGHRDDDALSDNMMTKGVVVARKLIAIGESVHASIPRTGEAMKALAARGPGAYETPGSELDHIRSLIESQANEGASYIAVNVDAFGESDPALAVEMMRQYVKLVRRWGKGVPVCVDSSNDAVLIGGLKDWFTTDQPVGQPLINSIKVYTADRMMPLKRDYDFAFVGLLMSVGKAAGPGGSHSVGELYGLAKELFDKAVNRYGFEPSEIYFDSTVFPLAIDMPMEPGVPGYTYRAFETIRRIMTDPGMKGVHCSLGVSNCARDLPARKVGICRAYVQKAMEYGLDAGIVNVVHHFGEKPADPDLVKLVDAFARMDGSVDKANEAMMAMAQFCASCR